MSEDRIEWPENTPVCNNEMPPPERHWSDIYVMVGFALLVSLPGMVNWQ